MNNLTDWFITTGMMIDKNTKEIESCMVPIFHGKKGERLNFVGTSIYFEIESRYFLFTAKHVALENPKDFYIPLCDDEFFNIPTDNFTYSESDKIDIAVFELVQSLDSFIPLTISQCLPYEEVKYYSRNLIAVGYPGSRIKSTSTTVRTLLKKFVTKESSRNEYHKFNADNRISIVVDFNKKETISLKGEKKVFPDPNGMSGGGLFWIQHKGLSTRSLPLLCGILVYWDCNSESGMKATKIDFALAILKKRFGITIPQTHIKGIKI